MERTKPRESITRVLIQQRIRFDLGLWNREENLVWSVGRLRVPGSAGVSAEANEILTTLSFSGQLLEPLVENGVADLC